MQVPERWSRIEKLFQSALRMDEQQRRDFLVEACDGDDELQAEVESLLGYSADAVDFMETPALAAEYIGAYRLIRTIATGGMGIVHEAEQHNPRRRVALKVLRSHHLDRRAVLLFQREAESLALLKHPGIAAIYEAGSAENGQHYFAMELVNGVPLTAHAEQHELTIRQRLDVFRTVCDAISYAHQRGVIHRDLKPSNIFVGESAVTTESSGGFDTDVVVKVLDFGLARIMHAPIAPDTTISGAGQIMGTLRYMSPEQARGDPGEIDARTDVYSLGIVLYELLTTELPYATDQALPQDALSAICEQPPRRPSTVRRELRGDLETIVLKAIEKDPRRRYQSVATFGEDIGRYLDGLPIVAHPPSSLYQLRKLVRRHKVLVGFAATVFALTLAFGITASVLAARLAREHQTAVRARENEVQARQISEHVAAFLDDMLSSARPDVAEGRELTVREVVDRAAIRIKVELADQSQVAAAIHDTIGRTYHSLGLYAEAEEHLRRGHEQRLRSHGSEHRDVLSSLNHLAMLLVDDGRYDEAETTCAQASRLAQRLAPDDLLRATTLNVQASLLRAKGDYDTSERSFREALRLRRAKLGDEHKEVATSLNNLAALLQNKAGYAEAEALYREALATRVKLLGEQHPDVANSLNNLAMLLWETGDYVAAEPLFQDVLELQRVLVGDEHQLVAATSNNLALVHKAMGNLDSAESLFRDALRIQRSALGSQHPDLAETLNNLAALYFARREFDSAEPLLREALAIRRAALGASHPSIAKNLNDLAAVLYARDDHQAAEPLYHQALKMYMEIVGPEHPRIGGILNNLASLKRAQGDYAESERFYRQSMRVFDDSLPADHPYLAGPRVGLGMTLLESGNPAAAEPLLRSGLAIRQAALPVGHSLTIRTANELAQCLIELRRFEEAESTLLSQLADDDGAADVDYAGIGTTLEHLVVLYERWQKPDRADEFRRRVNDLRDATGADD